MAQAGWTSAKEVGIAGDFTGQWAAGAGERLLMKKILVIDDEEWLRDMVQLALRQKGFEVIQAENGTLGIEAARKELPDLILCDVNMERVDGYLTLSALRSEPATASMPFILMTGLADHCRNAPRHGVGGR